MPETITSLIEKLEGAKIGSRELDCEIYEGQNPTHKPVKGQKGRYYDPEIISALGAEKYITHGTYVAPQYSNSLDAALALAERVLPGGLKSYQVAGFFGRHAVSLGDGEPVSAATPALALCAAILRAQSEARV